MTAYLFLEGESTHDVCGSLLRLELCLLGCLLCCLACLLLLFRSLFQLALGRALGCSLAFYRPRSTSQFAIKRTAGRNQATYGTSAGGC